MLRKKISVSITTALIFSLFIFGQAFAALSSWDLVDSSKHLDYDGNSSYMSSVTPSVNTWNSNKPGIIRKDTIYVIEDVYIQDYSETSGTLAFTHSGGSINFNIYNFKNMTSSQRQKTATHEIGHALGLDHTFGSSDVMKQGILSTTALSSTDKSSYTAAYNRY